jgi:hypothetical protein
MLDTESIMKSMFTTLTLYKWRRAFGTVSTGPRGPYHVIATIHNPNPSTRTSPILSQIHQFN